MKKIHIIITYCTIWGNYKGKLEGLGEDQVEFEPLENDELAPTYALVSYEDGVKSFISHDFNQLQYKNPPENCILLIYDNKSGGTYNKTTDSDKVWEEEQKSNFLNFAKKFDKTYLYYHISSKEKYSKIPEGLNGKEIIIGEGHHESFESSYPNHQLYFSKIIEYWDCNSGEEFAKKMIEFEKIFFINEDNALLNQKLSLLHKLLGGQELEKDSEEDRMAEKALKNYAAHIIVDSTKGLSSLRDKLLKDYV